MMTLRMTLASVVLVALTVPSFSQHAWTLSGGMHLGLITPIAWSPVVATPSPSEPRSANASITPTTTWGASFLAGFALTDWLSLRTGGILDAQEYRVVFTDNTSDPGGSSTTQSSNAASISMVTIPLELLVTFPLADRGATVIAGVGAGYTINTESYESSLVSVHYSGNDILQTTDKVVITMDPTSFLTIHGRLGVRAPISDRVALECGLHGTLYPGTDHLMEITSTTTGSGTEPSQTSTARRDWYHQFRATAGIVVTL